MQKNRSWFQEARQIHQPRKIENSPSNNQNLRKLLEHKEDIWIIRLKTFTPKGWSANNKISLGLYLISVSQWINWYQLGIILHRKSNCVSCHIAILVVTGRIYCYHDFVCYACLASLSFEHIAYHGAALSCLIPYPKI